MVSFPVENNENNVSYCDPKNIFTGKLKLEKVILKSSAFDQLGLPITVVKGNARIIEFDIPWKSIQSSPVVVTIKDLDVILGPNMTELGAIAGDECA